jgi:hypothetical protein
MTKTILLLTFIIAVTSCEKDHLDVTVDKTLIMDLNSKAKTKIIIGANEYSLEAYLWRDFMPFSPPDGKPLISINWLFSNDSTPIPANISMIKQYVINQDSIWIADYEKETHSSLEYKLEKLSRNGPKWGPHIYVDVISKITDTETKTDYYLKLSNVYIGRTD